jgi:CheB methylesterase
MADGQLILADLPYEYGMRTAVDIFFRTLAETHGSHSTAIILSGLDGDGSVGIKRIKENGGLTVAQDPGEAEHRGMPRSAIETGMVDWVLPVAEIPLRLLEYQSSRERIRLPEENPPAFTVQEFDRPQDPESAITPPAKFSHNGRQVDIVRSEHLLGNYWQIKIDGVLRGNFLFCSAQRASDEAKKLIDRDEE